MTWDWQELCERYEDAQLIDRECWKARAALAGAKFKRKKTDG